jgi:hypothetical protein
MKFEPHVAISLGEFVVLFLGKNVGGLLLLDERLSRSTMRTSMLRDTYVIVRGDNGSGRAISHPPVKRLWVEIYTHINIHR